MENYILYDELSRDDTTITYKGRRKGKLIKTCFFFLNFILDCNVMSYYYICFCIDWAIFMATRNQKSQKMGLFVYIFSSSFWLWNV